MKQPYAISKVCAVREVDRVVRECTDTLRQIPGAEIEELTVYLAAAVSDDPLAVNNAGLVNVTLMAEAEIDDRLDEEIRYAQYAANVQSCNRDLDQRQMNHRLAAEIHTEAAINEERYEARPRVGVPK